MPYATLSDVRDKATGIRFGSPQGFDIAKAEAIVTSINHQVESMVRGLGYEVPVLQATAPQSYSILKDIVVAGSIAQILKAMYYGVRNPDDVGANDAWREYSGKLKALGDPDNPLTLVDAVKIDIAEHQAAEISSGFSALLDSGENFKPTRDQVF